MSSTAVATCEAQLDARATGAIERICRLLIDGEIVAVGFSGGKDSSVVVGLALQAWARARGSGYRPHPLLVVSGDTGIENPAVQAALRENHRLLRDHARAEGIGLEIEIARPNVADAYLVQLISGRALPTWANTAHRNCSVSLKVTPGTRAIRAAADRIAARSDVRRRVRASPVVLVGSRLDESARRSASMNTVGIADGQPSDSGYGTRTLAPIADWSSDDVWEWLACASNTAAPPFRAWRPDFDETVALYREASGECPVVLGDRGPRSACGARHGCALCTANGARDRSLERMLEHDRNAYMRGLNELRNWLAATQYRWDMRARIRRKRVDGREVVGLGAGTYSPETCRQLLAMCLTLDTRERRRAEVLAGELAAGGAGDAYLAGRGRAGLPFDHGYARRMVQPQFCLIDLEMLVAIDFYWSLNGMSRPFEALRIYRDVVLRGREVEVPRLAPGDPAGRPKEVEVPAPGMAMHDGLRDHAGEFVMPEAARPRRYGRVVAMAHAEDEAMRVDLEAAELWLSFELDALIETHADQKPFAAAAFYLRNEIVRIVHGRAAVMDGIARRGQWVFDQGGWGGLGGSP